MSRERHPWIFSAVLGAGLIAGLRSFAAPAAVSAALAPRSALAKRLTLALQALTAGEMLADKLPVMPARTTPLALGGRALTGALLAGAAAIASSYAALALRSTLGQRLAVPDPLVALIEDAVVIIAGRTLALRVTQQLAAGHVERRWAGQG